MSASCSPRSLLVVAGATLGGTASAEHFGDLSARGVDGILRSAGLLFFAFAGYAAHRDTRRRGRGPRPHDPEGHPDALGITLVIYAVVAVSALAAVGPDALARSDAPLATAVRAGRLDVLAPAVRIGGAIAALGVLLSLIAGVSRTAFAMAADGELPRWLDAVHPTHKVPHRAELAAGALIALLVTVTDLRSAIGFSSFCVLAYYAIANASAWTLPSQHRRRPRVLAAAGVVGCATLAFTLPVASVVAGTGVLAVGALTWRVRHRRL